ncbi:septum site-determining protein MinC [Suilimivivens sp.]|uniref:septum site-determining protein MinC n=1 Tax=Suilimivivens sp. TaxID=2981669 RepID=UPI0030780FEF
MEQVQHRLTKTERRLYSLKQSVIIKSFPNGIVLHLSEADTFEEILQETAIRFRESRDFFKDAKMALSIKGRKLTEEEENTLLNIISENSDIHILCLVSDDEDTDRMFIKAISETDFSEDGNGNSAGQFYKGTLKNGEVLETEYSIVILGDVYPGSAIISARDIIVLGGLYGEAYAGGNGSDGHYVAALEMSPEKLKIGDFKYHAKEKSKWGIKPKVQPKIAYVKNKKIVMDSLTKELLSDMPL